MIDQRALLTFLRVCEAGSISGAARLLNISQPSVSNVISTLEARLGLKLFDRSRRGIILTAPGEALRQRATFVHNLLQTAESETRNAADGLFGPIRVGGTPGALVSLLPQAVKGLDEAGRRFELNVIERPDLQLNQMLRDGEIELAFVTTEIEEPPEDLIERTFTRDPFTLIVGRAHDALPNELSLANAGDLQWVLPEAHGAFRRQVDAVFVSAGLPHPQDVIRCDSLLTTKAIVRRSKRVTVLPHTVAAAELSIGVLRAITITDVGFQRSVGLRLHRDRLLSPMARLLIEQLTAIHSR